MAATSETSPLERPQRDHSPHEALNLSINNRSSPTTKATSLLTVSSNQYQHAAIMQRDSWPPDAYRSSQYKESQDSAASASSAHRRDSSVIN